MAHEILKNNLSLSLLNPPSGPEDKEPEIMEKPDGYVAKDVIYAILQEWADLGNDIQAIPNSLISQKIKEQFNGFEENASTISAYKSQYKKSYLFRPNSTEGLDSEMVQILKAGIRLAPIMKDMLHSGISKDSLKAAFNLTLETLE